MRHLGSVIRVGFLIVGLLALASNVNAGPPVDLPLPKGISVNIGQPSLDSTIPQEYLGFVGKWGGNWDGKLDSNLIVERVTPAGDALVVYLWGDSPIYNSRAGGQEICGKIANGVLRWGSDYATEFKLSSDGDLIGKRYVKGDLTAYVRMARMPYSTSGQSGTQSPRSPALPLSPDKTLFIVKPQPGSEIPSEYSAFVGKWTGLWGGQTPSNLIVELVTKSGDAVVTYMWGDAPSVNVRAGTRTYRAKIKDGVLQWADGAITLKFKASPCGGFVGEHYTNGVRDGLVVMREFE